MAQTKKVELTIVEQMIADAEVAQAAKKTLTDGEAVQLIADRYEAVTSKNAMLKLLRSEGFSIAMSRCFKIYTAYAKAIAASKEAK